MRIECSQSFLTIFSSRDMVILPPTLTFWCCVIMPMQKTWVLFLDQEDLLEKEMATLSSVLA